MRARVQLKMSQCEVCKQLLVDVLPGEVIGLGRCEDATRDFLLAGVVNAAKHKAKPHPTCNNPFSDPAKIP